MIPPTASTYLDVLYISILNPFHHAAHLAATTSSTPHDNATSVLASEGNSAAVTGK